MLQQLLHDIEKLPDFDCGILKTAFIENETWKRLYSLTHTGHLGAAFQTTYGTIESSFPDDVAKEMLQFSNAIGRLTAFQLLDLAGAEAAKMKLIEELAALN